MGLALKGESHFFSFLACARTIKFFFVVTVAALQDYLIIK